MALAESAGLKNQDIRIAEVQVREARALVQNARAAWYPSLGVDASVSRARSQTSTGSTTLGNAHARSLQASWEPDLWGRVRRAVEGASKRMPPR